ncbi:MAG: serpin family protein [Clostridia bacterium]|nr:serpin family protein [Clostridia bacterium]
MRKTVVAVLSIALFSMLLLTACSEGNVVEGGKYDISNINQDMIDGGSQFAFDVFKSLNNEDANKSIFISPLSISSALTMTYNGAETTTKKAMEEVLGLGDLDRAVVNENYSHLLNYLQNADESIELNTANSIWIRSGEEIKKDFLEKNRNNFNAEIDTLDFSRDSSVDTINEWIDNATKGKISKMLNPPINPDVIMYLINAIYFKGEWGMQFDPERTFDGEFKTLSGNKQTVKMMSLKDEFQFIEGDDCKAIRLPYGNGQMSMYAVLPNESISINDFIKDLDREWWANIRGNLVETDDVLVQMPKFKLEYGIKNLNDNLKNLGMEEAFGDEADFSAIREDVYISNVLHKAVIEVNEEGSEAAAATVVEVQEMAAMEPTTFIADRPFVFIIADDTTGSILFIGKLLEVE